jgi:hypothetical protein
LSYYYGFFGIDGKAQRQYKNTCSFITGFREHAHQWIIYPQNMGTHLSIDEVALSQGELLLSLIKKAKGKNGSLVAIVAGTKTEQVIEHISKIESKKRQAVIEITLDMANSMVDS